MRSEEQVPWVTPEEQISQTINTLKGRLALKGWPNSRRQDLTGLLTHLETQWKAYQAGMLKPFDPTVEV